MLAKFAALISLLLALVACSEDGKYSNGQTKMRFGAIKDKNGNLIKQGDYIEWYENGQKKAQGFFIHDRMDGAFYEWYENGQMKSLRTYANGELNGTSTWWTEDGHPKDQVEYENNFRR